MHRFFALDPARSSGVPLNPQFRNPPPGGNDPLEYDDAVTVPAGDIAENPYWKRDVRRSYPKLSVVTQSDVAGLLSVGSAAAPKEDVLKIGDAGQTQLVEVKEEGEKGLSAYFEKNKGVFAGVLGKDGLPPLPTSRHPQGKRYKLIEPEEQTYGDRYVERLGEMEMYVLTSVQLPLPDVHLDGNIQSTFSWSFRPCTVYIFMHNPFHVTNSEVRWSWYSFGRCGHSAKFERQELVDLHMRLPLFTAWLASGFTSIFSTQCDAIYYDQ